MGMVIGLMRVEIKLAVLAALAAAVLVVPAVGLLFGRLQRYSKGSTSIAACSSQPYKSIKMKVLAHTLSFEGFLLRFCFQPYSCNVRLVEYRPARYVDATLSS
jgi:hypothetical protein